MSALRQRMRWTVVALGLLVVGPPMVADDARDEATPPPVGVRHSEGPRGRHLDAVVPGRLLALAWPRLTAGGPRAFLLLVAPEEQPDGPRTLYRLGLHADARLETLRDDLPAKANALRHRDADGDGLDEVLLGEPGVVYRVWVDGADVTTDVLMKRPGLDLRAQPEGPNGHGWTLVETGRVHHLAPGVGADAAITDPLPVTARRSRSGLRLGSPPVHLLDRGTEQAPLVVVGPEAFGPQRLRTVLIDPEMTGEDRQQEIWSILPGPEDVEGATYVLQDGRPRLLVSTINAEKLVIFGRKRLRSFPLLADRTRRGKQSSLNHESTARSWQRVDFAIADADGDGQDDLLVAQRDGLGGGKVVVEAHVGRGSGRYAVRPHKTVIDREIGGWHLGDDIDGDGHPDLLIRAGDRLALHPGIVHRSKRRAVEPQPAWEIDLRAHAIEGAPPSASDGASTSVSVGTSGTEVDLPSLGRPLVTDLDDEGSPDVILTVRNQHGRGRLHVVRLGG